MKFRYCYVFVLVTVFAALVISGAVFFTGFFQKNREKSSLEVRDQDSGKVYGKWFLEEGGEFSIEFIHSVNQSPVKDTFIIENGMIRLLSLRFYAFGAGMPTSLEEGQELSRDGDAMIITGFNSSFRELNYIVGTISDHLLFINGETVSLRELCGRNAHISIKYNIGTKRS